MLQMVTQQLFRFSATELVSLNNMCFLPPEGTTVPQAFPRVETEEPFVLSLLSVRSLRMFSSSSLFLCAKGNQERFMTLSPEGGEMGGKNTLCLSHSLPPSLPPNFSLFLISVGISDSGVKLGRVCPGGQLDLQTFD